MRRLIAVRDRVRRPGRFRPALLLPASTAVGRGGRARSRPRPRTRVHRRLRPPPTRSPASAPRPTTGCPPRSTATRRTRSARSTASARSRPAPPTAPARRSCWSTPTAAPPPPRTLAFFAQTFDGPRRTSRRSSRSASPTTSDPTGNGSGTVRADGRGRGWAGEANLDVQWAYAIAPKAHIVLLATPPAETQGVQGLPNLMKAIDWAVATYPAGSCSRCRSAPARRRSRARRRGSSSRSSTRPSSAASPSTTRSSPPPATTARSA